VALGVLARFFGRRPLNVADPTVLMVEISDLREAARRAIDTNNSRLKRQTVARLDAVIEQCHRVAAFGEDATYAPFGRGMMVRVDVSAGGVFASNMLPLLEVMRDELKAGRHPQL